MSSLRKAIGVVPQVGETRRQSLTPVIFTLLTGLHSLSRFDLLQYQLW